MTKLPAVKARTSVVSWQKKLEEEAVAGAAGEVSQSEFVSFKAGVLTFNGQQIPGNAMEVVVLDSAFEHALYADVDVKGVTPWAYDVNNPRSPSCYAMGRVESELAPADKVQAKQSESCSVCRFNEWGSDPAGGKGKACKNVRRLTLMDAGVLQAGEKGIAAATPVFAKLPVTSGKNFSAFVIQIANVTKRPPYGVIAKMSVVPDQRTQFQVKWEFVDMIPDALIPAMMAKKESLGDDILFDYPENEEPVAPSPSPARGRKPLAKSKLG